MKVGSRRALLSLLTTAFLAQTWLVYSDPSGRRTPPLSELGRRGQEVWHDHNCQSCHQLYGFGGFLGPDLTNLMSRVVAPPEGSDDMAAFFAERFEVALTSGSARMPAFDLELEDRLALGAFLEAVDRTGVGQTRIRDAQPPRELFAEIVAMLSGGEELLGAVEEEGRRLVFEHGCIDCHLPNGKSAFRAPDLTRIHTTVDPARVATVLVDGIPQKGMPRLGLSDQKLAAVTAFLAWLEDRGSDIRQRFKDAERGASGSLADLPWFEYPR